MAATSARSWTNATPAPDVAFLDKEWLCYNSTSRQLVMSYTRFFFGFDGQSGAGQVELARARVPADPQNLSAGDWGRPSTVWPEESDMVNTGAYVSVAPNGDAYVSWERNVDSNTFNGDPYVFIHAARVRPAMSRQQSAVRRTHGSSPSGNGTPARPVE